jgi:hypothetical protein
MWLRRAVCFLVLAGIFAVPAAASGTEAQADRLINSSEPQFLRDIGPKNQDIKHPSDAAGRDSLLAAFVVVSGVALVISNGLDRYDLRRARQSTMK